MRVHLRARVLQTPRDRARDLVGRLLGAERVLRVAEIAADRVVEFRDRRHREHDADVDAGAVELEAERLSEPGLRRFRGGVRGPEPDATLAGNRRDHDQMSFALTAEDRHRRARGVKRAHEVHVEQPRHDLRRCLFERAVKTDSRIRDHHVEPSELRHRPRDHPGDVRSVRHVARNGDRPAARGADRLRDRFQSFRPPCHQRDRHAEPAEVFRRRAADSRRRAGDGDDPSHEALEYRALFGTPHFGVRHKAVMRRLTRIPLLSRHNGGAQSAPARERRGAWGPRERPSRGPGRSPG